MKLRKLIYFEWIDSTQDSSGWNTAEETKKMNIHGLQAGGMLLYEDAEKIIICPFYNPEDEKVLGAVAVPQINIKKDSKIIIDLLIKKC